MPYQVSMMGWIGSVKTFVGWVGSRNFVLGFEKVTHDQLCATLNRQPQDFGQNPVICRSANPFGLRTKAELFTYPRLAFVASRCMMARISRHASEHCSD